MHQDTQPHTNKANDEEDSMLVQMHAHNSVLFKKLALQSVS